MDQSTSNPWLKYPALHIPMEIRERLESMIRDNLEPIKTLNPTKNGNHVRLVLLKKGFRDAHVDEVLKYRSELVDCLDWLFSHVPEDDLPLGERPDDKKSIILGNLSKDQLVQKYAIDRLQTSGFHRSLCKKHYESSDGNEMKALISLNKHLANLPTENVEVIDVVQDQVEEILQQEKEVLASIYDNMQYELVELGHIFRIQIESVLISIHIPIADFLYPNEIPGLSIQSNTVPAYIRLALLQRVVKDCHESFRGSPMIFSIVGFVEQILPDILSSPPPLASLYEKGKPVTFDQSTCLVSHKKSRRRVKRKLVDSTILFDQYQEKKKDSTYQSMLRIRQTLPSFKYREQIIDSLKKNQVLICCGETGCGKSTQLGQFILDDMIERKKGQECFIYCTQPRRISAIALAERVSQERAEKIGSQVGYSIRGESKQSDDTKLLFCTTGVLLRTIQDNPTLEGTSHVIIDEVHERGVESDFLLVLIRDLLPKRSDLKVILMSATIDAMTISQYFSCPVLEIPGRTFPVTHFFLESILEWTGHVPENTSTVRKESAEKSDKEESIFQGIENLSFGVKSKLMRLEQDPSFQIDYGLIAKTVNYICESSDDGAILIFMPGAMEIKKAIARIRQELNPIYATSLEIFPLHSMLTSTEQNLVFRTMPKGKRKVVVSTNIAETSVTIDDVVYCIDVGRVKEMKVGVNGILSLQEVWASKAACKQRKGRAGRVKEGYCYKLYSSVFESKHMRSHTEPEILRLPLEQLCLQIKAMGEENVVEFLSKALSPPPVTNVNAAMSLLHDVNAVDGDGRLTALGRHVSHLPTDVRVAKMLVFGAIFECLEPILTIAACISGKGPFNSPMDKRVEASQVQNVFFKAKSDHLAACAAYEGWNNVRGRSAQKQYCDTYFLSMTNLMAIHDMRKQFLDLLIDIGYVSRDKWEDLNRNAKRENIVKSVILAGLQPNVAGIQMPKQLFDKTAEGTVAVPAKSKEIKFFSHSERVFLHPSSSLFSEQKFNESVLVFSAKVATSKIFLRDCSVAPSIALLLLGGSLESLHGGHSLAINKVRFQAFPRISSLIRGMRKLVDEVLEEKSRNPQYEIMSSEIGQLVVDMLERCS